MKVEEILKKLENYKSGTFAHIEWEKDISSAKAKKQGIKILKKSSGIIRTEINYENLKSVQNIEMGNKESWFEHYTKGILQSKKDSSKKYLQAFPIPNKNISVNIFVNGMEEENIQSLYEKGLINKDALTNVSVLNTIIVGVKNIKNFRGTCCE